MVQGAIILKPISIWHCLVTLVSLKYYGRAYFHLFSNINGHPYQQIFADIPLFELLQKFLLKKYQMKMGVKFNITSGVDQQQQYLPRVQI